jgi:NadR type nicotinamide-nucleotide adenylyltransferase
MKKGRKTGLVLGKFLPPHLGHQYLIDFARNYVDELIIVIGARPEDPIPGELRTKWLKEMYPDAKIIKVDDENPPDSDPQFWTIWEKTLKKALPYIPEYLFASEDYGWTLSKILGMKYIPVDHHRRLVPVSAEKIRKNPMKYWKYIPAIVRPYYLKRVCIFGPESTGKTILTRKLAKHFNTVFCDEYARGLLEFTEGVVKYGDIDKIAKGHRASEDAMARQANKILFSDTDIITTVIWSRVLFGKVPKWIEREVKNRNYDLYLLLDVDVPWVKDNQRYLPTRRKWFMNLCITELKKHNRNFVIIRGSWSQRFKNSVREVKKLI